MKKISIIIQMKWKDRRENVNIFMNETISETKLKSIFHPKMYIYEICTTWKLFICWSIHEADHFIQKLNHLFSPLLIISETGNICIHSYSFVNPLFTHSKMFFWQITILKISDIEEWCNSWMLALPVWKENSPTYQKYEQTFSKFVFTGLKSDWFKQLLSFEIFFENCWKLFVVTLFCCYKMDLWLTHPRLQYILCWCYRGKESGTAATR